MAQDHPGVGHLNVTLIEKKFIHAAHLKLGA